jgi:dolichyl-phosphate-mannose-protein mannosyltransferase
MANWQTRLRSIVTHPLLPVFLVCLLSFSLRINRLQDPGEWYFDEVYHGFTAVEYAAGNHDAYNPWAQGVPEGVAFEWVHPPLAKLIMASSVALFGPVSWAWRLPSTFFGTAVIGLSGILAWVWWKNARIALLTSAILAVDGLVLVMSRLAMNDVFFLTFLLLALIASSVSWESRRWKWWTVLAAVSLGAALASKWTTIYIVPFIALDTLVRWSQMPNRNPTRLFWIALSFVIGVPVIYLLSHTQYFLWGYTWDDFVMLQKQIWWYHTQLDATHPYQSSPWQWILDLRPVWFYSGSTATLSKNIYALANPIFLWTGLLAVLYTVIKIWRDRPIQWSTVRVLFAYGLMWLPWAISPRIMFFYHYLPALPFLAIILAKAMGDWEQASRRTLNRRTLVILSWFAVACLWLIIFYPHLTGLPVSAMWAQKIYYILPTWR